MYRLVILFSFLFSTFYPSQAQEELKIVTWNASRVFSGEEVFTRSIEFQKVAEDLKPDILLLQEVSSLAVVQDMMVSMGLEDYYSACSNFDHDDEEKSPFEVAIISKYPLTEVIEFDPTPDNCFEDPEERPLITKENKQYLNKLGIKSVPTRRGFLWARIDTIQMTVAVVHLKSSRKRIGVRDRSNAKKREFVAGAVALQVVQAKKDFPNYNHIVAGDFNVAHSDRLKNGINLKKDSYSAKKSNKSKDRYDETHAILSNRLVKNLSMQNLTKSIQKTSFPGFENKELIGTIDNIYFTGNPETQAILADLAEETYGSDHLPVWVQLKSN